MSDAHEQGRSYRHGKTYEDVVETLLQCQGYEIIKRHWREPTINVEIDLVVRHKATGKEIWVECKGSWEADDPNRNGACRTDSVLKLIGAAWMISRLPESLRRPYVLVTSHAPDHGATRRWLDEAHPLLIHEIFVTDLRTWKAAPRTALPSCSNQPFPEPSHP